MSGFRCPECGRFMGAVLAWFNGNGDIKRVEGTCSVHGRQATNDWSGDDFDTDEAAID